MSEMRGFGRLAVLTAMVTAMLALGACQTQTEWQDTAPGTASAAATPYENCATIDATGFTPDEVQLYVIDVIKPSFAAKPNVSAISSQAMNERASFCVTWLGVSRSEADRRMRERMRTVQPRLPDSVTTINFS